MPDRNRKNPDLQRHPADPAWFHGQISLEHGPGWLKPWRLPFAELELYIQAWWKTWSLLQQAGESTGVRLRFASEAGRLELECEPLAKDRIFDLVVGNELRQTATLTAGAERVAFDLPGGACEIWLPHHAPCAVRAIHLQRGRSLIPVPDRRRLLVVYGSSITHCQGAHSPARTWPAVVGRRLDLQVINLGFSGNCHAHTLLGRVLRDLPADLFVLKLGINILADGSLNGSTFMPNVAGLVRLIRERHASTPIALVSPIISPPREDRAQENAVGMSIAKFREQLADTAARLRRVGDDRHVHYVDGTLLFGAADTVLQPDGTHPSAEGTELLGRRVAEQVIPLLDGAVAGPDLVPAFANPVHPEYLADPFCFHHEGWYYAVGTGKAECHSPSFDGPVVPMVKSPDLRHWQPVGRVLELPPQPFTCFWAPEIAVHEGRFYMYYHPCLPGQGYHIRVAVADRPEGPYRDSGRALTDHAFSIDAHPFRDDDGQWWLFYATDFLDVDATTFRGTALVVDRLIDMTRLAGEPRLVMRAHWPWQRYEANQKSHGVVADWYTLEGPAVCKRHGRYYCFYSGGNYQNETYGVDWLEADAVTGPWREIGCERGPQLMRSIPGVIGPGHHSIVSTPGGVDYVVYHAWNPEMTDRQMCVDRLVWTDGVPSIARFAAAVSAAPLKIVLCGDSTMCEYPLGNTDRGWGMFAQAWFNDGVTVINLAKSGRSTKTYIAEGLWKQALDLQPDFVLIQFGHNDSHPPQNPEATNASTDYMENLRRCIDEARAINAKPVLITPMVRRLFGPDGRLANELQPYADAMKQVAAEKKVPLIDLHAMSRSLVERLGPEGSAGMANRPGDRTHFGVEGAKAMAGLVRRELPIAAPELKGHLERETPWNPGFAAELTPPDHNGA